EGEALVLKKFPVNLTEEHDESSGLVMNLHVGRGLEVSRGIRSGNFSDFLKGRLVKSHAPRFKVTSFW
ncbi:hypothetical protein HAX54_020554, partial [Datura stramonium]|nr:hypothetical protein [Datura stramonium]